MSEPRLVRIIRFVVFALALALAGSCSTESTSPERVGTARSASVQAFAVGSLIIPMDTTYQDVGMLKAYGLVYQLTLKGIPVHWAIDPAKAAGGSDFTASATDVKTNAVITGYAYRGGPFLVDSADAAAALPIVATWQASNTTTVHKASAPFSANISRKLVAAPKIGVFLDGNELIAFNYLNAAGIPDSLGQAWPTAKANSYPGHPDILSDAAVAGPTTTNHADGALVTASGAPAFCHLTSMHYGVNGHNPEVVAETRHWLTLGPVHFFAECQAVNAFENDAASGHMLASNGFVASGQPSSVSIVVPSAPFAQLDGAFKTVGGSEPAYDINGGTLYAADSLLVQGTGAQPGKSMVFLTGYLDGISTNGKVSYLGGHTYTTATPISTNPTTQGTRLFLNGIVEAPCASDEGQPSLTLTKTAPASTTTPSVTFSLAYANAGPGVALAAVLTDPLPPGATFVSASNGGSFAAGTVTWNLGDLAAGASGTVTVTVSLSSAGPYDNQGVLTYKVGNSTKTLASNTATTTFGCTADSDCAAAEWCNTQSSTCATKLPNGQGIPAVPGHTPALTGACTTAAGAAVCASGVCDAADNKCGYANGDGPCTTANGGLVCRSGICGSTGTCTPPTSCNVDADCPGTWCNESLHLCAAKLSNGAAMPIDAPHTSPTLDGTCAAAAAALVCLSGVCDTADNKCGYADGDGPCTTANGAVVCRSGACSVDGTCEPTGGCNVDADCSSGTWCDESTHACTPQLPNGASMPIDAPHTSPTLDGTCTGAAAALVCASGVCDTADDKCGYAVGDGPCTAATGAVVCRSGACSVSGTCEPAGGCNVDADCSGGAWCNESAHACTLKLANGTAIPSDPPHTSPTLDGTCTAAAATLVCMSGVCDTADGKCGYANGDGPCTTANGAVVCRSGICDASGVCAPPKPCSTDQDCDTSTQYCDTGTDFCAPKLVNGGLMPVVPGHTPTLDGTCSSEEAVVVCLSGVCDTEDNGCGYADGTGPCTAANGSTVCRSTFCATQGPNQGLCVACADDSGCSGATPVCDATSSTCVPCDGDLGSGAAHACGGAGAPYCFVGGAAAGQCGKCITDADCAGHPGGPKCDTASGACASSTLCHSDTDCDADHWCDAPAGGSGNCTSKLDNGTPLPETPPGVATCSAEVGQRVCKSGVCDPKDDACGLADGDGPCASGAECRDASCDPTSHTCKSGCTKDAECPAGDYCRSDGACAPKLPNGSTCDAKSQCISDDCTDHRCVAGFVASGNGVFCAARPGGSTSRDASLPLLALLLAMAGMARRRR